MSRRKTTEVGTDKYSVVVGERGAPCTIRRISKIIARSRTRWSSGEHTHSVPSKVANNVRRMDQASSMTRRSPCCGSEMNGPNLKETAEVAISAADEHMKENNSKFDNTVVNNNTIKNNELECDLIISSDSEDSTLVADTTVKHKKRKSSFLQRSELKQIKVSDSVIVIEDDSDIFNNISQNDEMISSTPLSKPKHKIPKTKDIGLSPIIFPDRTKSILMKTSKWNKLDTAKIAAEPIADRSLCCKKLINECTCLNAVANKQTAECIQLMRQIIDFQKAAVAKPALLPIVEETPEEIKKNVSPAPCTIGKIATTVKLAAQPEIKHSIQTQAQVKPATETKPNSKVSNDERRGDGDKNNLTDKEFNTSMAKRNFYRSSQQFISDNIYVASKFQPTGLKPIVIDGSNIAMCHGQGRRFSVKGLKICIDFFLKRGHRVYAFIPSYRLKFKQSDNQRLLHELVERGLVFCTASREVMGRKICSYDDRILVQAAAAMSAVIVSSDNYRDLQMEDRRLIPIIEKGVLSPTWVNDMIIFPDDPLGRYGPNLNRFLRFP